MPRYRYQCSCGVLFSKMRSASKYQDPCPCPDCGKEAPRKMPAGMSAHFNKKVTGPVPQNTGVHDLDNHIDRIIGVSAEEGWLRQEMRVEEKVRVLEDTGADPHQLSKGPDDSWRIRDKRDVELKRKLLRVNNEAMAEYRRRKRKLSTGPQ